MKLKPLVLITLVIILYLKFKYIQNIISNKYITSVNKTFYNLFKRNLYKNYLNQFHYKDTIKNFNKPIEDNNIIINSITLSVLSGFSRF